jgi:hypothetical protein
MNQLDVRPALLEDNRLSLTMDTESRICSLPASESTVRGFSGVSLLIADEGSRIEDSLFAATVPFVAISRGTIITCSTPNGKQGWFYQIWSGSEPWYRQEVTANQCPRLTKGFLEEQVRLFGRRWVATEFYCQFTDPVDAVFAAADVEAMTRDTSVRPLFRRIIA